MANYAASIMIAGEKNFESEAGAPNLVGLAARFDKTWKLPELIVSSNTNAETTCPSYISPTLIDAPPEKSSIDTENNTEDQLMPTENGKKKLWST